MKHFKRFSFLSAMLLIAMIVNAQGNLSGIVRDAHGETLPGASIMVKGSTLGTSTDINGSYTLLDVPAGQQVLVVNYIGYEPIEKAITISRGKNMVMNFTMKESAVALSGITVTGVLSGQRSALNQQKTADNLMQVISAEQMDRFPDINVSDALRRLSGVTSNGKEVQLRGTPANFTNINVNGEQIMGSQEAGKRNESMDVIPTDILSSMEVQKTLLPSNDGDAIAGVINMRTGIARSLRPSFQIDLGSGYTFIRDKMDYNAKFSYAQRFFQSDTNPDGTFGVKVNYAYMANHNGYDRMEAEAWEPYNLINQSTGEKIQENMYFPTDFRYRYQENKATRHGVTVTLDWQPTKFTKFILSSLYNYRDDDGLRYRYRTRFRPDGDDNYYQLSDGTIGSGRMRYVSQVTSSDETVKNFNINLDGETTLGSWKIDGGVFYTKSRRDYNSEMDGFQTPDWRAGKKVFGVKIPSGTAIAMIPGINKYMTSTPLYKYPGSQGDEAIDGVSMFNLYTKENWVYTSEGDNFTVRLNANKNYFIKDNASTLSFGVKGKFMGYNGYVPDGVNNYAFDASDANNLKNMLHNANLSNDWLGGHMSYFGAVPDIGLVRAYIRTNPSEMSKNDYTTGINKDGYYYDANENVLSGYVMNKIQFKKLMFLSGFRIENTHVDYKANKLEPFVNPDAPIQNGDETAFNDYKATPVSSKLDYTEFLPNVQFKYDFTDNTIFRLAWTTGYARPNVADLVPKQGVTQDIQRVTRGNPDLKSSYAHNLDFLFEHYLSNVGILSGGIFYKHISNFIYQKEGIIDDANDPFYHWQLIQTMNGDAANLYGAEITVNSSLTFLPGFLKNLLFTGNYTYIHSKAKSTQDREAMRLPGQAKSTANLALSYSSKRFTLQVAYNYIGAYIESLGSNAERDIWRNGRWQMDVNGSMKITKGLSFWVEAVNVLNSEAYSYFGDENRAYNIQYNGCHGRCGFTYKF
ncbi:MAG: TonB-dependent receptor [Prevotella sp.]|nr:TonB-dependent receptor [Prevotella sp.]MDY4037944.1 TonB-dependent receptor [Prevotella sp.]